MDCTDQTTSCRKSVVSILDQREYTGVHVRQEIKKSDTAHMVVKTLENAIFLLHHVIRAF